MNPIVSRSKAFLPEGSANYREVVVNVWKSIFSLET